VAQDETEFARWAGAALPGLLRFGHVLTGVGRRPRTWFRRLWRRRGRWCPVAGDRQQRLFALGAASSNNVWAVGERWVDSPYSSGQRQVPYPLIEHWDGRAWTVVQVGNPNRLPGSLYSITVVSATDAWAVGGFQAETTTMRNVPLVEHWNGVSWSLTPVPALANAGPHHEQTLVGVAATSSDDVWAVGNASVNGTTYVNRLLHWNGQTWARVAASEPSSTSGLGSISLLTAHRSRDRPCHRRPVDGRRPRAGRRREFHLRRRVVRHVDRQQLGRRTNPDGFRPARVTAPF
jgi:hypothetical protein